MWTCYCIHIGCRATHVVWQRPFAACWHLHADMQGQVNMIVPIAQQVPRNESGEDGDQSRDMNKSDSQKHQRRWLSRWLRKGSSQHKGHGKHMDSRGSAEHDAPNAKAIAGQSSKEADPPSRNPSPPSRRTSSAALTACLSLVHITQSLLMGNL